PLSPLGLPSPSSSRPATRPLSLRFPYTTLFRSVNSEEGGDDVKSSCPLCPGLHTCYNGRYNGQRHREVERIPESRPEFGLGSATRPHEVGVASNRRSAMLR